MSKYIEVSGSLYETAPDTSEHGCGGCAFERDQHGCVLANTKLECMRPKTIIFKLAVEKKPARSKCAECVHVRLAGSVEPCNSCHFGEDAPTGWYPKFEPRPVTEPKPVGAVTAQLQKRLPEIPDGPGWTDVVPSGMLPCGYHDYVDLQFRDGGGGSSKAGDVDWGQRGLSSDVVRYRVTAEPARNGRQAVIPIVPEMSLEQASTAALADQPCATTAVDAHKAPNVSDKRWCETCEGTGKVYQEHQRGCHVGGEYPCPDCDGKGWWAPRVSAALPVADATSKPTNPKDLLGVRKVPMSCVPAGVMMEVALALGEGAAKYGRHNYRGVGVRAAVYYDAAIGHLMDWWEGDDVDAESGLSHVVKSIASLVVLRDAMLQGKLTDDRPPRSKVFKRDFNPLAGEILDRHADKSPYHWTIESPTEA